MRHALVWTLRLAFLAVPSLSWSGDSTDFADSASTLQAQEVYRHWTDSMWSTMRPQHGDVQLPGGFAVLHLGDSLYYLNPTDAQKVIVDVWGNPDGETSLGMIFPDRYRPFHANAWGAILTYDEDGHVSDEDAGEINYDDLLEDMQKAAESANKERIQQGYGAVHLLGWAEKPYYDSQGKRMYWAKDFVFGDAGEHTLNYYVRYLGRKGVLNLNFVAGMEQLPEIRAALPQVLAAAEFIPGQRYADYQEGTDKLAAYGLAGLVAGGVATKLGLLAKIALALKKLWIVLFVGLAALWRRFQAWKKAKAERHNPYQPK